MTYVLSPVKFNYECACVCEYKICSTPCIIERRPHFEASKKRDCLILRRINARNSRRKLRNFDASSVLIG